MSSLWRSEMKKKIRIKEICPKSKDVPTFAYDILTIKQLEEQWEIVE